MGHSNIKKVSESKQPLGDQFCDIRILVHFIYLLINKASDSAHTDNQEYFAYTMPESIIMGKQF